MKKFGAEMRRYGDHWLKGSVVQKMRQCAIRWPWDGRGPIPNECVAAHMPSGTLLIFTRDSGHHSSGWFKNPDYERCWHLSLSFRDVESGEYLPFREKAAMEWIDLFFGDDKRKLWVEPPAYPEGKQAGVWHYRLFCDEGWQPIKPRGEVYSRELTEAGFKSWSEIHAEDEAVQSR